MNIGIYILYFMIIVAMNTIGAVSGMGGGVLIKPTLDIIHYHDMLQIAFYSSVAVFTMSISSTIKQIKNKVEVNWGNALLLAMGSVGGGLVGEYGLTAAVSFLGSQESVRILQNYILILTLLLVLLLGKMNWKLNRSEKWLYFVLGLFLGSLSVFLGIGGGPINVSLLLLVFPLSIKQSTTYSIITIFFSQISKLLSIAFTTGFRHFDMSFLLVIIPAAILGGLLGASLSHKSSDRTIARLFYVVVVVVILMNLYSLIFS